MIKMKPRHRFSVRALGAHPIGIVAQHEARQAAHAVLAFTDLAVARAPIGKLEQSALVLDADVEVELVEASHDRDRPVLLAALRDGLDKLSDRERRALDDVGPRTPKAALLGKELLGLLAADQRV